MLAGNLIFGGVIGAGIDTADGAGFSYPSEIDVNLSSNHHQVKKKSVK